MIKKLLQKFQSKTGPRKSPAERMLTLHGAKIYYLPVTKCGSTFLKNLFYYLDHANEHPAGDFVHSNPNDLLRAKRGDEEVIKNSPHAFAVLRDPVDRFMSLYFDKIYGDGPQNFEQERLFLRSEIALDLTPDIDADGHYKNCIKLIDWVERNLAHETDQDLNHHWKRQTRRLKRVEILELQYLTLDGLNQQLPALLEDILPNIRQAMTAVRSVNRSEKPFAFSEILDTTLRAKIEKVYSRDKRYYDNAVKDWEVRLAR